MRIDVCGAPAPLSRRGGGGDGGRQGKEPRQAEEQQAEAERGEGDGGGARAAGRDVVTVLGSSDHRHGPRRNAAARDADALISDLPARGNPRGRLARDQCIPAWALLTGGLGEAKI